VTPPGGFWEEIYQGRLGSAIFFWAFIDNFEGFDAATGRIGSEKMFGST